MKRLYARLVFWMIRPALDVHKEVEDAAMRADWLSRMKYHADADREGASMRIDAGLAPVSSVCEG
ncbi:hypothetical protein [Paraburkholderia fungorum]|uniref:hypothetical protein n=1 Tax=Paraburkholderia fungorum TaxID=134537 RepID=UPI000D07CB2A|nr:hypothetical protein [Paraburkholderia fungorum]PRZ56141.1 hypothetical protein BX589_102342 [Paraburkholderia fungorum]